MAVQAPLASHLPTVANSASADAGTLSSGGNTVRLARESECSDFWSRSEHLAAQLAQLASFCGMTVHGSCAQ
jgi:hypothetical protein